MADNRDDRSRNSQPNSRNIHDRRHPEENPPDVRPSRDRSQPVISEGQLMSVQPPGVQSHPPMEVDITQRNPSGQTVQSYRNGAGDTDQQLATGSSVYHSRNKGPTQFGERNTVNYYITNTGNQQHHHHHYHCPHQPPHLHGNSSYHDPTHCQPCLVYHHNDHQPLVEYHHPHPDTQPRQLGLSHHPVPQLPRREQQMQQTEPSTQRAGTETHHPVPQLLPREQKMQQTESSTQRAGTETHHPVPQLLPSTQRTESTAPQEGNFDSRTDTQISRSAETRQVSDDLVPDNVTIIDSSGSRLMPGDAVWLSASNTLAVYIGNQEVVYCERRDSKVVKRQRLELTEPFRKYTVVSGECRLYPGGEVIRRAKSRVGTLFTEGDWSCAGSDFPTWAMSGVRVDQAVSRGFRLDWD